MKIIKDIIIVIAITIAFLLVIEGILRLSGFGYSSRFLIEREIKGRKVLINNVNYTIPFFSRNLVRTPMPIVMDETKRKNTYRIFIAGESAVMGDPDYSFGAGRILEVILKEQFPGYNFEIINTAITAINSNVILPIVKETSQYDPDLFIFYIGNNEVIGPYGPTSVFLPFLRNPYLIKSSIAINASRIGQIARSVGQELGRSGGVPKNWEGMEMYLKHQLSFDDPRLQGVYSIYKNNLQKMCHIAVRKDASVILCTVASNLRDCAPFGSVHGTTKDSLAEAGDANLHFKWGREFLLTGNQEKAYEQFIKARDFDVLRFRTDTKLNNITREVFRENDSTRVLLLDFERIIRSYAENGISGYDLFYEHVHFNFQGNYFLAINLAAEVQKALKLTSTIHVPSIDFCKSKLAFNNYEELEIYNDVISRYGKAPFIQQLSHNEDISRLQKIRKDLTDSLINIKKLESNYLMAMNGQGDWLIRYNYALYLIKYFPEQSSKIIQLLTELTDEVPQLATLFFNLGFVYQLDENYRKARENYARALKILPGYRQVFEELGKISIVENKKEEARTYFKKAQLKDNQIAEKYVQVALNYARLRQIEKAKDLMNLCLTYDDKNFNALYSLGGYHLTVKEYALACNYFVKCTTINPQHAESYYYLGKAYEGMGRLKDAVYSYNTCTGLQPENTRYYNNLGRVLYLSKQFQEAIKVFSKAIEIDPGFYEAYINLADCYLALDRTLEAWNSLQRLDPEKIANPEIRNRLSIEYKRLNDADKADSP